MEWILLRKKFWHFGRNSKHEQIEIWSKKPESNQLSTELPSSLWATKYNSHSFILFNYFFFIFFFALTLQINKPHFSRVKLCVGFLFSLKNNWQQMSNIGWTNLLSFKQAHVTIWLSMHMTLAKRNPVHIFCANCMPYVQQYIVLFLWLPVFVWWDKW